MGRTSKNMVDDAREQAKLAEHAFLRQHGWTYTSATPSCHWLWESQASTARASSKDERQPLTIEHTTPLKKTFTSPGRRQSQMLNHDNDALGGEAR